MFGMAAAPGLPFFPFAILGATLAFVAYEAPERVAKEREEERSRRPAAEKTALLEAKDSVKEAMRSAEVELCLGKQLAARLLVSHNKLAARVAKMRRKFARQYGFVVPEIRLSDSLSMPTKNYQIKIHGTVVASHELRIGDLLVITGDGRRPALPGDDVREPAFGMRAVWISQAFANELSNAKASTRSTTFQCF
jgi:flagellar biosynthesis protein FlhA